MEGFFSIDGKGFRFLSTASELIILNLLWLLCSLPIVTIGASTTALYSVVIKIVKNEDSYVARGFFASFKRNFRQATAIWLMILGVIAVLYFDFYFSAHAPVDGVAVLFVPFALVAMLLVLTVTYVFPVLAVFDNSTGKTLKNSLYMALAHLPYSVLAVITATGPAMLLYLLRYRISIALFMDLVIGFAFFAWVNSHIFVKLFERYIPKDGDVVPEEGV